MRLLEHNALRCHAKGVETGYPLILKIESMSMRETEPSLDFMKNTLDTISWECLLMSAEAVGLKGFPNEYDVSLKEDQEFLVALHRLLIDVEVEKGTLTCPESGRVFPIENGVPDFRLPESECA